MNKSDIQAEWMAERFRNLFIEEAQKSSGQYNDILIDTFKRLLEELKEYEQCL